MTMMRMIRTRAVMMMMRLIMIRMTMMRMIMMRTWWWSVVPHCELIRHRPAELDSATETNFAAHIIQHCTLL